MLLLCYVGHARISRQHSAAPQWGARPGTPCSIHAASRSVECRREPVINQAQMVIRRLDRQRERRGRWLAETDTLISDRCYRTHHDPQCDHSADQHTHTHTHLPTAASSLTTRRPTTQYQQQQQQQQRHSLGTSLPGSHRYLDEMQVSTWPGPAYTTSCTRASPAAQRHKTTIHISHIFASLQNSYILTTSKNSKTKFSEH